jgi:small-conductance mechanosensitive channel
MAVASWHCQRYPTAATSVLTAIGWVAAIVVVALILEFAGAFLLRRPRTALTAHLPRADGENIRLLRLLPFVLVRLLLDLVPIGVFAATGNLLTAAIPVLNGQIRLLVLAIVNAYAICRAALCAGRMLISPGEKRLRLWRLDDASARFVMVWLRRIVIIAVFGDALVGVALLLGLDQSAHDGLERLIALALALLLIAVVIRSRRGVAAYIRAPSFRGSHIPRWRAWLAEAWPYLAVITIVTAWVGAASGTRTGIAALYLPGVTLAAVIVGRLAVIVMLGTLERALYFDPEVQERIPGLRRRIAGYRRPLEYAAVAAIAGLSAIVLLQLWGAPAFTWFTAGSVGHRLVSALLTITVAVIAAAAIWEVTHAMLDAHLSRLGDDGRVRAARLMTLLPMLRTALLTTILTIVGLTALSEIGVNIAPLLAGAGIAGIAIGFGSQRLVQDVITGVFVLFENVIQIGDGMTVAGLTGKIEALSVRTMRLRASDGSVHIIPFSSVTTITNSNRGLGNAAVSVTVAYDEDTDRVGEVLGEIADEMRQDREFAPGMLSDLQLNGVDALHPWGVTVIGQIVCTDTARWQVQREFNRRMKKRFEELGIKLGGPENVLVQS